MSDSTRTLAALRRLSATIDEAAKELEALGARAEALGDHLRDSPTLGDVMDAEERPLIVTKLTALIDGLMRAGTEVRRAEAHQLREEGYTHEAIAEVMGVTRQRASSLLKPPPPGEAYRPRSRAT